METNSLPRDKTRRAYIKAQMQSIKPDIYVPEEVLHVFDKDRDHLQLDSSVLGTEEISEIFGKHP
jgi:hypothetical protein